MESFLLFYILLLSPLYWWLPGLTSAKIIDPTGTGDLFNSPAAQQIMRLAKSAEMRSYLKPAVSACDDFYQYSCGNWAQINPAKANAKTDVFHSLSESYFRKLSKLLSNNKQSNDSETNRKVKYFYESCLERDHIKRHYREHLLNIMEEFGGMPALKGTDWHEDSFDWLRVIAEILRKYGIGIILGVKIDPDFNDNEKTRLYIGQIDDVVPGKIKEFYELLPYSWKVQLENVLGLPEAQALITAREMSDFAQKLASGMVDPLDGLSIEDMTRMAFVADLTDMYGPAINFTYFVQTWLGHDYNLPVYEYAGNYIRNLKTLVLETPTTTVANYIMWMLIQDFRLEAEESVEKHRRKCVRSTRKYFVRYLDNIMYQDLVKTSPEILEKATDMWQHLKTTFENIIKSPSASWMMESTRAKALEKLSAMTFEINGYANTNFSTELGPLTINAGDYFENVLKILKLRGDNFRMKLQEPPRIEEYQTLSNTPAYVPEYNRVMMPVYYLHARHLWSNAYPKALQYSTIGFVIAHEMVHGFDDTIRKFDAKGNFNNWWDRNSSAIFETRKECLRQQYGTYRYGGKFLPKSQAQGENIADNVGIRIAYQAYDDWLSKHHQTPEHLPNMDTITSRQLFFISAAQAWCTDINRHLRRLLTSTDVHPPAPVRVLAMMTNFDAFAKAFECKVGSQMNPHKKCLIY